MKKSFIKTLIAHAVLLSFLISCSVEKDCFKSTGRLVTRQQNIKPFNSISLFDNIDLQLSGTSDSMISIEAGENLVDKINLNVIGEELAISNGNKCNWVRDQAAVIKVKIGIHQNLLSINHNGYGKVYSSDTLKTAYLLLGSMDGGGDFDLVVCNNLVGLYTNSQAQINLSGATAELNIKMDGLGRINAEKLIAKKCTVKHNGSNEVRIFPLDSLNATINQNGNILYYNNPKWLWLKINGSGSLIKKF